MGIAAGKTYKTRDGGTATVWRRLNVDRFAATVRTPCGHKYSEISYHADGRVYGACPEWDIVLDVTCDMASQFIRLWNCGLIAIPSVNGQGVDALRHYADGARMEATYPTLREALRCAHKPPGSSASLHNSLPFQPRDIQI